MVIDFHTHIGRINSAYYAEKRRQEVEKSGLGLIKEMKKNKVDRSIVFAQPMVSCFQREKNDELLREVNNKKELIPFAFLDPQLEESPALLKYLISVGFRGLKLHPIVHGYIVSHSMCFKTYEVAEKNKLPVLVHSGWGTFGSIAYIAELAAHFPKLNVVIGHMLESDAFYYVSKYDNLFIETSYASHPRRIEEAVKTCGSDKILFGSDWPYSNQQLELMKIKLANISEKDRTNILSSNAKKLLRL